MYHIYPTDPKKEGGAFIRARAFISTLNLLIFTCLVIKNGKIKSKQKDSELQCSTFTTIQTQMHVQRVHRNSLISLKTSAQAFPPANFE